MKTWVLFISFIPTVISSELTFLHSANKLTYDDAAKYCKRQGQYFLPDDVTNSTQLVKYMNNQGITSVWLALKKKTFQYWTWTNGKLGRRPLSGIQLPDRVCAGVSTVDQTVRAMRCNYGGNHEGFICEKRGDSCSNKSRGEYCFLFGKSSFTFKCGINDWYTAELRCRKNGRFLAVLDFSDKVKAFVNEKNKQPALSMCSFYWVGLRKEEWNAVDSEKHIRKIEGSHWAYEEPQYGKDCSVASPVGGRIGWTTEQCNQIVSTVCVKQPDNSLPSDIGNSTTNIQEEKKNLADESPSITKETWFIPTLVGAGVFLVLVLVATIWCLRRKKRKQKGQHREQCAERTPEQTIEEQPFSSNTKGAGKEAITRPSAAPVIADKGTEQEHMRLLQTESHSLRTIGKGDNEHREGSGRTCAGKVAKERQKNMGKDARRSQTGLNDKAVVHQGDIHRTTPHRESHGKPNSCLDEVDASNKKKYNRRKLVARTTSSPVGSKIMRKELPEPLSLPQNTTRNCEKLGKIFRYGNAVFIGMVLSSFQELHMNKYLAGNTGFSRSGIKNTLQVFLSCFYKRILGWQSEEELERGMLGYMNMLNTQRFVDDSYPNHTEFKEVTLDIIYLESNENVPHAAKKELVLNMRDNRAIITRARHAKRDFTNFEGHWYAYGDDPDFLVYTDYYKHKVYFETEEEPEIHEIATIYTTVVAALVIMLARNKVWNILKQPKLKSTDVMREILRRMCSHPEQMTDEEGYGVLDPWPFLLNWNKMKDLLNEVVK